VIETDIDYDVLIREELVVRRRNSIQTQSARTRTRQLKKLIFGLAPSVSFHLHPGNSSPLILNAAADLPLHEREVQKIEYSRVKPAVSENVPVRMKLPASLPREEVILEPAEDTTDMKKIGEEITEELNAFPESCSCAGMYAPNMQRQTARESSSRNCHTELSDKGIRSGTSLSNTHR